MFFCDKTFAQNNEMKIHEENHTGENLMRDLFVTYVLFVQGLIQVKNLLHVLFFDKTFAQNSKMKIPERNHTGEKPYSYLYCDKTNTGKDIIQKHGRTLMEELLQVKNLMYVLFVTKNLLTNNT